MGKKQKLYQDRFFSGYSFHNAFLFKIIKIPLYLWIWLITIIIGYFQLATVQDYEFNMMGHDNSAGVVTTAHLFFIIPIAFGIMNFMYQCGIRLCVMIFFAWFWPEHPDPDKRVTDDNEYEISLFLANLLTIFLLVLAVIIGTQDMY